MCRPLRFNWALFIVPGFVTWNRLVFSIDTMLPICATLLVAVLPPSMLAFETELAMDDACETSGTGDDCAVGMLQRASNVKVHSNTTVAHLLNGQQSLLSAVPSDAINTANGSTWNDNAAWLKCTGVDILEWERSVIAEGTCTNGCWMLIARVDLGMDELPKRSVCTCACRQKALEQKSRFLECCKKPNPPSNCTTIVEMSAGKAYPTRNGLEAYVPSCKLE